MTTTSECSQEPGPGAGDRGLDDGTRLRELLADRDARTLEYGPDGRVLQYATYGDPDGEPLVFLHGTPGSRILGALFDEAARNRGVCVLAPDRPGFGGSTAWPNRRPADASAWVEPLLVDANASSARVVAFSGGSADALALAGTRPGLVSRVDLVSGAPPPAIAAETPRLQERLGQMATHVPRLLGGALRVQRWLAERDDPETVLEQYTDEPDAISAAIGELVRRDFVESCHRSRNGAVTELSWVVGDWGVRPSSVECPVRVWHGKDDENVPLADAERLCERLPEARLTTVDGDHLTTLVHVRPCVLDATGPRN